MVDSETLDGPATAPNLKGFEMRDYRTIDITTIKGLREAERLKMHGWTIVRPGMFTILMQSPKRPN